ncbi:helix-turn-helix domain-containing protein [Nitrospirillum sp. BR 11828]|uniref:helix-turn-helix domain-containing protein n=1 Tax=Nitrospirillum sp. BR 11828 TaxID=3104325 RepID=UPI002ACA03B8|nr:helix-turn-helix domain-containing protein [Nitrospirillum sp. BR 11828]MDZ5649456.1 helix-turn-helix domain-containing protein [Nitrospirillum sp. BR 11828]
MAEGRSAEGRLEEGRAEGGTDRGVPIRAISRAIAVLKAINRHGSLTMMDIARAAGLPYPTTCRLVQTLIFEGLVEQEPDRKQYRPTALVQSLAYGFQQDDRLVEVARPHILALTRRIGWPVSIAMRVGAAMVLRDSTHAKTPLTFDHYYPGFTVPLLESASGKLSLAHAPAEERRALLAWMEAAGAVAPAYLRAAATLVDVTRIRRQGYAVQDLNHHNLTPGKTSSIAVPIFLGDQFKAAMTLIFFASSMDMGAALDRYLGDLRATAQAIGAALRPAAGRKRAAGA